MARSLNPLHDDETGPQCPEALLISAYLETGKFTPELHHIQDSDIAAWRKLWNFAIDYQQQEGMAPPVSLVRARFPDFVLVRDVGLVWAATQVRDAGASRGLRTKIHESLQALNDEDLDGAYGTLTGLKRPRGHNLPPADVLDHMSVTEPFDVTKIKVPWPSLGRATGGIGNSELWLYGARFSHGKSWMCCKFAAFAAQLGYRVCNHSLEMPWKKIARRTHTMLADGDPKLMTQLKSTDVLEHKKALDAIAEKLARNGGSIKILSPSHGQINTCSAVAESGVDYDLVIVDHVGLMLDSKGRRAVEDWHYAAEISNTLHEDLLAIGTPVLGAIQINREGDTHSPYPPSASKLALADVFGQDADVIITGKRLCKSVMVNSAEKVREGPDLYWYNRFDPARGRFSEITKDDAYEISRTDEDFKAGHMGG